MAKYTYLTTYLVSRTFALINQMKDQNGRIFVIEVKVNDEIYEIENIYNPNTESEYLPTFSQLSSFLENFNSRKNSSWWKF